MLGSLEETGKNGQKDSLSLSGKTQGIGNFAKTKPSKPDEGKTGNFVCSGHP